jgi:uncharacterized protein (TIGR03437 family)
VLTAFAAGQAGTAPLGDFAPALQWVKTVNGSGADTITAAGADAIGNLYIVGTTSSIDFPTMGATQHNAGGTPLVRIEIATGVAAKLYPAGLSLATSIASDSRNPATLYASTSNALFRSIDQGSTWSPLSQVAASVTVRFLIVDSSNSNTLYAATDVQGVLKSTDGGLTWNAINTGIAPSADGTISATHIWTDPKFPQVLFAATNDGVVRTANGGVSWSVVSTAAAFDDSLIFDPFTAGTVYWGTSEGILKSTDEGQTFVRLSTLPDHSPALALVADPAHAGVFYAGSYSGIYRTVDSGMTWVNKAPGATSVLAVDPGSSTFYANIAPFGIVKTTDGFSNLTPLGPPVAAPREILIAGPNLFELTAPSSDVFAVKFDLNGNVVYSTYFGGSATDAAAALAVGPDGSLYVTGPTLSIDFPVTADVDSTTKPGTPGTPSSFVFKLNPDGSLAWSTYFADFSTTVDAIAVDSTGAPYISGSTSGRLPTTPGAYQTDFQPAELCGFQCLPSPSAAFVTKFRVDAAGLVYSTYVSSDSHKNIVTVAQALAVDSSGNVWFGGRGNVVALNASGSGLIASTMQAGISIAALALDSRSNVYATGSASTFYPDSSTPAFVFPATLGAVQPTPQPATPFLPGQMPPGGISDAFVIEWDNILSRILAATLLGGELADAGESIAVDAAGNVIISGITDSKAFPTHAPFQVSFSVRAGFVAGLDSSLSHLYFSTYLGDSRPFDARMAVFDHRGNVFVAGSTLSTNSQFVGGDPGQSFGGGNLAVVNLVSLPAAPALRLDSVVHLASRLAGPIAPGEPILAIGSGFENDAQLVIDGALLTSTLSPAGVEAVIPDTAKTSGTYVVQVSSRGSLSNPVYVPAAPASPGIYSVDNTGYGQGYILNSDGTLNSPMNPASPGSPITIFASGVGSFTLTDDFAVTAQPPAVFIDGFYANGIIAEEGPVDGFLGNVFRIKVLVPNPATPASQNPNLVNFRFPPQVGVKLIIGAVNKFNPDNSAMISEGGLLLNVR